MIRIMINDPVTEKVYTEVFDRDKLKVDSFYRMQFNYAILRLEASLLSDLREEIKQEKKK